MGPTQEIMDVVYTTQKSRHLNMMENYYIYHETSTGMQINNKNRILKNRIFHVVVHHDTQQV